MIFKSDDEKRQEAAIKAKAVCAKCNGTGYVGGNTLGRSQCWTCGGSGMSK
jgi:DnaJ-class molecular chaperone